LVRKSIKRVLKVWGRTLSFQKRKRSRKENRIEVWGSGVSFWEKLKQKAHCNKLLMWGSGE
jgi:hypothetical protein